MSTELMTHEAHMPTTLQDAAMQYLMGLPKTIEATEVAERIFNLLERQEAKVAEQEFNRAYAELQSDIPPVEAKGKPAKGKKLHITYKDMMNAAKEPMKKHGFSLFHEQKLDGDFVVVITKLRHRAGHELSISKTLPRDDEVKAQSGVSIKNSMHTVLSTETYAIRYNTKNILGISEDPDQDNDGSADEAIGTAGAQEILDLKIAQPTINWILSRFSVGCLEALTKAQKLEAINLIKAKQKEQNGGAE